MGLAVSVAFDPERYEGKLYMPRRNLKPFPQSRCRAPGQLVTYFRALPPSLKSPSETDNLYWWVDCQFLPFRDNELCCSVGAYYARPGRTSISVSPFIKGLIYTMKFSEKLSCGVIKGTSSTAMPRITPHPDGSRVCYIGTGCINVMNLLSLQSVVKNKDMRNNNFRYTTISPNGIFIGAMARISTDYELAIIVIDSTFLLTMERYECRLICPGFRGTRSYTEEVECKFSPDSKLVAISSSMGLLFVVNRGKFGKHNIVIGKTGTGLFDVNDTRLSTVRAFDFDPRYFQRILTFASANNVIYICDILANEVETQIDMGIEEVVCLQYCPHATSALAVATAEAQIHLFNPDTRDKLYTLDGQMQGSEASMRAINGVFPTIIRMSFSREGQHMAVSSTDGIIRVWQIRTDLSLQNLCRNAILKCVPCNEIQRLSLPAKIILYLLQWPSYE